MNNSSILKSLFVIKNVEENNGNIQAKVAINKESEIYKAHFPGDPITPGVCQMHLVKDVLTQVYPKLNLLFKTSKQIKFTEVLRPTEHQEINISIDTKMNENELTASAQIFHFEKIFFKAKLTYICEE